MISSFRPRYKQLGISILGVTLLITAIWFRGYLTHDELMIRRESSCYFVELFQGRCLFVRYTKTGHLHRLNTNWMWATTQIGNTARLPRDSFLNEMLFCSDLWDNKVRQLGSNRLGCLEWSWGEWWSVDSMMTFYGRTGSPNGQEYVRVEISYWPFVLIGTFISACGLARKTPSLATDCTQTPGNRKYNDRQKFDDRILEASDNRRDEEIQKKSDEQALTTGQAAAGRTTYTLDASGKQKPSKTPTGVRTTVIWNFEDQPTRY